MYRPGCDRSVSNLGGITCLTPVGVLFSLVLTYAGFICLIAGAPPAWRAADLPCCAPVASHLRRAPGPACSRPAMLRPCRFPPQVRPWPGVQQICHAVPLSFLTPKL